MGSDWIGSDLMIRSNHRAAERAVLDILTEYYISISLSAYYEIPHPHPRSLSIGPRFSTGIIYLSPLFIFVPAAASPD